MTTTNSNPVDSSTENLLQFFNSFSIKKEDIIPETDLLFCRKQQKLLYETLDRIKHWYDIFRKEAEQYRETHHLSYADNGIPDFKGYYKGHDSISPGYKKFEFKPFDVINQLAENRFSAIRAFTEKISGYFNDKYNVSVPVPEMKIERFPIDFRPVYHGLYCPCRKIFTGARVPGGGKRRNNQPFSQNGLPQKMERTYASIKTKQDYFS